MKWTTERNRITTTAKKWLNKNIQRQQQLRISRWCGFTSYSLAYSFHFTLTLPLPRIRALCLFYTVLNEWCVCVCVFWIFENMQAAYTHLNGMFCLVLDRAVSILQSEFAVTERQLLREKSDIPKAIRQQKAKRRTEKVLCTLWADYVQ